MQFETNQLKTNTCSVVCVVTPIWMMKEAAIRHQSGHRGSKVRPQRTKKGLCIVLLEWENAWPGVFPFQVIICDPLGQADKDFEAPESIQDDPGDR